MSHVERDLLDAAPPPRRPHVLVHQRRIAKRQAGRSLGLIGGQPLACSILRLEVEMIPNLPLNVLVGRLTGVPGHVTAPRALFGPITSAMAPANVFQRDSSAARCLRPAGVRR